MMMMMMNRCSGWLALVLLVCVPLFAQAAPATPAAAPTAKQAVAPTTAPAAPATLKLSLQDAINRAVQSHPNVQNAQEAVVAAQAAAVIQEAARWPHVDLEANATQSKSLGGFSSTTGTTTSGTQHTTRNVDAAVTYTIWQSGLNDQIRRAQTLAKASMLGVPDARRLLTFQVRQAYYNILAQQYLGKSLLESVANSERHLDFVQARVTAGTAPRSDVAPIEVEVAQARLAAVQTETNLETGLATLKALIMVPATTTLELSDTLPTLTSLPNLTDMLALADEQRPDLAAQKLSIRAAHLGTEVARAQAGLQLAATASGDYGRHTGTTGDEWQVTVGATYPLFDAGASRAGVTQAQAGEDQAVTHLQLLELGVQQDVESAVAELRQTVTAIEVAGVARSGAETALANAEARYKEGLAIIIEVTDAQVALLQAQVAETQAQYNHSVAIASLALAIGGDLPVTPAK